jgi:hypothetical protein
MTPIHHNRRAETVNVRRAELGIRAGRTKSTMAVRAKHTPSGAARAFHLESRVRHPLNLTGREVRAAELWGGSLTCATDMGVLDEVSVLQSWLGIK